MIGDYVEAVPQPSIAEKGMMTMRLHLLHFNSKPCPHTLAINCPHSQRVSRVCSCSSEGAFAIVINLGWLSMKLRTIISISGCVSLSRPIFQPVQDSSWLPNCLIIPSRGETLASTRSLENGSFVRGNDLLQLIRLRFLDDRYSVFNGRSMVETLPRPSHLEARLYEVLPYPRYHWYSRRHRW
jgi:hypothetical protein